MDKPHPLLFRLMSQAPRVLLALLTVVLIGLAYLRFTPRTQAQSQLQPVNFNHQIMVQLGITCVFCHTDATRSPAAGMPSVAKCMGCHSMVTPDNPEIKKVAAYWAQQEPIPWPRVYQVPRFVYFSHRVHVVAGGFNCERCHGDVGNMTVARPVVKMNMGWCLSCHEQQPNAVQLQDCVVCHQ
jgi:hypothetical protein